jgi:hypothetical protein
VNTLATSAGSYAATEAANAIAAGWLSAVKDARFRGVTTGNHCLLRSEWERTGKASKRKQTEPTAWVRNDRVGCAAIQAIFDIMRYCYRREILSDL